METVHYLRLLGRSWFIVIITLVAGGAGGYYVYRQATPMYRSSVRLIVSGAGNSNPTDEVTSRLLAIQRAQSLSQIAGTAPAIKAASSAAGYPAASPSVTSTSDVKGPFLTVTVEDTNAVRTQSIANAFASILPKTLVALEGRSDTSIAVASLAPAPLPASPFSPKEISDLGLGLAAGLILGIAIALLREATDRTLRDSEDLARTTELTVLGTVPRDLPKNPLPAMSQPRSARAEAYRQIRTTLLNSEIELHTIAVTSATVGEGKTSVATNLAAVFSRAGHRVAIVDADLRRPRVAAVFKAPPKPGLSDVLDRRVSLDDVLTVIDDGRLAILTSGTIPANPSEALGGALMKDVLAALAADYEYVFVDTPPVLPVTDALVVAPLVDGVILVTKLGSTTHERVRRAQAAVHRVNASFIGVVPNHAGKGTDRDYRYGYKYAASHKKGDSPTEIDAGRLEPTPHHGTAHEAAKISPSVTGPPGRIPYEDALVLGEARPPTPPEPPARPGEPEASVVLDEFDLLQPDNPPKRRRGRMLSTGWMGTTSP